MFCYAETPAPGLAASAPPDPSGVPNNHLGYAFTWFGMAVALVGVFAAFVRTELRKTGTVATSNEAARRGV